MRRSSTPRRPRLAALAAIFLAAGPLLSGCIASRRPIVLDSTPPGADVFIDGVSTGHATPCKIQLADKPRTVEFRLAGYETESRSWVIGERSLVVFYMDSFTNLTTWPFPLFLGAKDFFFPVKVRDGEMPNRIHVRMSRSLGGESRP